MAGVVNYEAFRDRAKLLLPSLSVRSLALCAFINHAIAVELSLAAEVNAVSNHFTPYREKREPATKFPAPALISKLVRESVVRKAPEARSI